MNEFMNELNQELERIKDLTYHMHTSSSAIRQAEEFLQEHTMHGFEHSIEVDKHATLSWEDITDGNKKRTARIMFRDKDPIHGFTDKAFQECNTVIRIKYYKHLPRLIRELSDKIEQHIGLNEEKS